MKGLDNDDSWHNIFIAVHGIWEQLFSCSCGSQYHLPFGGDSLGFKILEKYGFDPTRAAPRVNCLVSTHSPHETLNLYKHQIDDNVLIKW